MIDTPTYNKIGDSRVNKDGSISTLVDAGDSVIGTYTVNCPKLPPLYLHSNGTIHAYKEGNNKEMAS